MSAQLILIILLISTTDGETAVDTMGQLRAGARYRYLFLAATVCGSGFLLLSLHGGGELFPGEPAPRPAPPRRAYTIHTDGCTIPGLKPYDQTIAKFIKPPLFIKPCPNSNFSLLDRNDTHIWVRTENLPYYHMPSDANITCCYRAFYRPSSISDIISEDVDKRVKYERCTYFSHSIEVEDEFVRVLCRYHNLTLYEQYFPFAPHKPVMIYDEDAPVSPPNNSYNVIILGIDAVSRLNFHRTMPKTYAYLKKKGSVELLGYNKVGDNTFPNLTPMLLGFREAELRRTCWPNIRATFDNCPFIWDWFKDVGYYTALGEDSASLGTFNYGKFGFTRTPTDYYMHTFMSEAESRVGNNKDFNSQICMSDKYFYKVLLDYVESLTVTLKSSRLFGFFWEVTMSHDYLNYPMVMDNDYEQFLIRLDKANYLDETILIVLSDHGIRWGDIRYTKQGRLEERLPLVQILTPPSFKEHYNAAYNNLKVNSRGLTTPFDIHATLADLVDMETITDSKIQSRSQKTYAQDRSVSLFLPIPRNRTCKIAGIEDHWCTCHTGKKLPTEGEEAQEAATQLMRQLNALVREHEQCARLRLAEVLEVTEMLVGTPDKNEVGWREYMVVARAAPGGGVFEATLRRDDRDWTLAGTVSRLNLYGDQSRCVHHYQLKLYCYCQ